MENQAIPKLERKLRAVQDEYQDLHAQKAMLTGESEAAYGQDMGLYNHQ